MDDNATALEAARARHRDYDPSASEDIITERASQDLRALRAVGNGGTAEAQIASVLGRRATWVAAKERELRKADSDQRADALRTRVASTPDTPHPEEVKALQRAEAARARGDINDERREKTHASNLRAARLSRLATSPRGDDELRAEAIATVKRERPWLWLSHERAAEAAAPKRTAPRSAQRTAGPEELSPMAALAARCLLSAPTEATVNDSVTPLMDAIRGVYRELGITGAESPASLCRVLYDERDPVRRLRTLAGHFAAVSRTRGGPVVASNKGADRNRQGAK